MSVFAVVGSGELGGPLAEALGARVCSGRDRGQALAGALRGAACVIAAVPASAAADVAEAAARHLDPGAVYADPSPRVPAAKEETERVITGAGALYADVAVLGTTAADGARVPMLAAGPGAGHFAELAAPFSLNVTVLEAPAGAASLVKLLRSVYMKGRDALILEMLLAARRYGVETALVDSIRGSGEQVPFPELAERVMTALAIHAERRADELDASAAVLAEAGIDPLVAAAAAERLRRASRLGLRERFGGERPADIAAVLEALDEVTEGGPAGSGPPRA